MIIQFAPTKTRLMATTTAVADTKVEDTTDRAVAEIIPCEDMRKVGLKSVGERLSANHGDLGEVLEARAKADIFYCPVCPEPHVA